MNDDSSAIAVHTPFLLTRARSLTRNEADAYDLVQDTCLHAIEAMATMRSRPDNVRGWLLVVMRNHWFNVVRHRRVRANVHVALASEAKHDTELFETSAIASQIRRAWGKLSVQAQAIAQQCLLEGDPQDEVSQRVGITAAGVAKSIHRTRETLRRAMFDA